MMPLTPRQVEAVRWLAEGKTAAEIGAAMGVTHWTAQRFLADAMRRIDVRKETALVATALRKGWIQ